VTVIAAFAAFSTAVSVLLLGFDGRQAAQGRTLPVRTAVL